MRRILLMTSALVLLSACNGGDRDDSANIGASDSNDMVMNTGMADPGAQAAGDQEFANAIAAGGRFEIESATMAIERGGADLKNIATMIKADHEKAGADLKAAAAPQNITPDDTLTAKQTSDLASLTAATGPDFDRIYVEQQIAAHEEALAQLNNYAASGSNAALKDFASKTAVPVEKHLTALKNLRR